MLWADGAQHARLRGLVSKIFTPRAIADMEGRIELVTHQLLDDLDRDGAVDLMSAFALPLPLAVISEMLGVPDNMRLAFHQMIMRLIEVSDRPVQRAIRWTPALPRLLRMFEAMIEMKRRSPDIGLISQLIAVEDRGDHLTGGELVGMVFLLLFAGHETSANLICSGILALLDHPDQLNALRERPDLIDSAIEELLRFTTPVEYGTMRFATQDVRLANITIRTGETVMPLASSANRDESVFDAPDRLDVTRTNNRHLALGFGTHYCLGANLGRLEARAAIGSLLQRCPDIRLAVPREDIRWRQANGLRGVTSLPVHLASTTL